MLKEVYRKSNLTQFNLSGPAEGEHEIFISVDTPRGLHESTACDVTLAADEEDLDLFIKKEGNRKETTTEHGQ